IEPTVAPTTGTVRVMSQAGADVYFAGRRVGHTPLTVSLPLGRQELEVRYVGQSVPTKVVVHVEPNKPVLLSLSPEGP
ncbi:MAG: PEGA domain-containing protein, partial [Polyangiaceae bacterium]